MERTISMPGVVLIRVGQAIALVLSLPIRILAATISWIRAVNYDPEEITCPACGFKGDSGTGGKSCRVSFIRTMGDEKAALKHTCFRCGCDEIYTKLRYPAEKWLLTPPTDRIKEAMKRSVI